MVTELIAPRDIAKAQNLLQETGLAYEKNFDNLVGIFEGRDLVAAGARQGNILKMLAVSPSHRGGSLLGELVTELMRLGYAAEKDDFFVFTSAENAPSFEALNFVPLARRPRAVLLEHGGGLRRYLDSHRRLRGPGENGAVVVNCNPFTLGHRYLIEEAARRCRTLYVFVVREDRSAFPFEIRLRLVREGVGDLPNVAVLDSSVYAVSALTFPAYFLKNPDESAAVQMEIDAEVFGRHLAPFFNIRHRFLGSEPYCRTTRLYGETLRRLLPDFGVRTVEIERLAVDGEPVSAFRVREAVRREAHETLRRLVPETTLDFLLSGEAIAIRKKLMSYDRRH